MLIIERKKTLVIAHRGESGYFPENTMLAFKEARNSGADMIELDVTLSRDKVPVVIHDDTVNRTTNGNGLVREKNFKELEALDAGGWFGESFCGEKIPAFEEVCEWIQGTNLKLNVEIKSSAHDMGDHPHSIEAQVVRLIQGYGIENRTMISSFSEQVLQRVREKDDNIPLAYLWDSDKNPPEHPIQFVRSIGGISLNLAKELIPGELFQKAIKDFPIFAYTVNHIEDMKRMVRSGVNGIFTNFPKELKNIIQSQKEFP